MQQAPPALLWKGKVYGQPTSWSNCTNQTNLTTDLPRACRVTPLQLQRTSGKVWLSLRAHPALLLSAAMSKPCLPGDHGPAPLAVHTPPGFAKEPPPLPLPEHRRVFPPSHLTAKPLPGFRALTSKSLMQSPSPACTAQL